MSLSSQAGIGCGSGLCPKEIWISLKNKIKISTTFVLSMSTAQKDYEKDLRSNEKSWAVKAEDRNH